MGTITDNFNEIIKNQAEEIENLTELLVKEKHKNQLLQKEYKELESVISYHIRTTRLSTFIDLLKDGTCLDIYDEEGQYLFDDVYYKNEPDEIMFDLYGCNYIVKEVTAVGNNVLIEVEEPVYPEESEEV